MLQDGSPYYHVDKDTITQKKSNEMKEGQLAERTKEGEGDMHAVGAAASPGRVKLFL